MARKQDYKGYHISVKPRKRGENWFIGIAWNESESPITTNSYPTRDKAEQAIKENVDERLAGN